MPIDTGINAGLGASNYQPFLQGVQQGASMQAQGSQNMVSGALQGLENYSNQIKQNRALQGQVDAAVNTAKSLLPFAQKIDPDTAKSIQGFIENSSHPSVPLEQQAAGAQMFSSHLGEILNYGLKGKEMADQQNANIIANYLEQGNGQIPSPVDMSKYTPNQIAMGKQIYLNSALTNAKIADINAQTYLRNHPRPAAPGSPAQQFIADATAQRKKELGLKPNEELPPNESTLIAQKAINLANPKPTLQDDADKLAMNAAFDTAKAIKSDAEAAREVEPVLNQLKSLIPVIDMGPGQETINKLRGIAKSAGIPVDEQKLSDTNYASALFGQLALSAFSKVKNLRTQNEFNFVKNTVSNLAFDKKSANSLINLLDQKFKRTYELDKAASSLFKNPAKFQEFNQALDESNAKFEKSMNQYSDSYTQPNSNQSPVNNLNTGSKSFNVGKFNITPVNQ